MFEVEDLKVNFEKSIFKVERKIDFLFGGGGGLIRVIPNNII